MAGWLQYEPALRVAVLLGMLGLMAGWEVLAPRRALSRPRRGRWFANLGLIMISVALLRLALPAATVGVAILAQERGWGLLPLLTLPAWLIFALSLLLLDLALYTQHVVTHQVPLLWRMHRVHHTDLDFDVTTGIRFHPAEILLSQLYKMAVVAALGLHPVAVLAFELLLTGSVLFNHSNIRLPAAADRAIRRLWVTPDMHRVHHSALRTETDSNYGSCLSLWDRIFGTYNAQPQAGHEAVQLGLETFRAPADQGLWPLLWLPLRRTQPAAVTEAVRPN